MARIIAVLFGCTLLAAQGCSPTFALAKEVRVLEGADLARTFAATTEATAPVSTTPVVRKKGEKTAGGAPLSLAAELATPTVQAGSRQRAFLKIGLLGSELAARSRAPVNLALVLDRSSSMAGDKIEEAKRAAILAVERLGPADTLAVIAYDTTVAVIVPPTRAIEKDAITAAIASIEPQGSTALFAGVSQGANELRSVLDKSRVNRVILLSDGMANIGPSSPGELAALGASLAREGISVTTVGLGLGYNEDLMMQLALASDGNHSFVEHSQQLAGLFDAELGDVLSVVAQQVDVRLRLAPGATPIRVLGRDAVIDGNEVRTRLNQVYGGQEKFVLVEVELPALAHGQKVSVGVAQVEYFDLQGQLARELAANINARGSTSAAEVERDTNTRVLAATVELLATEKNKVALLLRDEGKVEEARRVLQDNEKFIQQQNKKINSPRLKRLETENRENSMNLDEANWNRSRKQMRDTQFEFDMQQMH
jgi:Ca-activated chloride channel family protein